MWPKNVTNTLHSSYMDVLVLMFQAMRRNNKIKNSDSGWVLNFLFKSLQPNFSGFTKILQNSRRYLVYFLFPKWLTKSYKKGIIVHFKTLGL